VARSAHFVSEDVVVWNVMVACVPGIDVLCGAGKDVNGGPAPAMAAGC
jgi:hypothetical protein